MSRTVKREWSAPDGWHVHARIERKARPAGRLVAVVEAELADDAPVVTGRVCNVCREPVATNYVMGPRAGDWADWVCDADLAVASDWYSGAVVERKAA